MTAASPYRGARHSPVGPGRVDLGAAVRAGTYETEGSVDHILGDLGGLGPLSNANSWRAGAAAWATFLATLPVLGLVLSGDGWARAQALGVKLAAEVQAPAGPEITEVELGEGALSVGGSATDSAAV